MTIITPGMVFQDRYVILSKLGEGGFGQVWLARQRVTEHEVAVKVLPASRATDEVQVARFQREMRLCAQLHHPNIVRLIDSGRVEPDLLYSVFEYVPGRTLADVLASEGALQPWEAAHLMLQVLDALGCAHKKNVIHRDLKPHNLMVTDTGVRRNALVLDFGLGTLSIEGERLDQAPITRTMEVLGTPAYAAPEQLRGEPATERSDLYSWGLIFLECLTGRRVVEGATLQQVLYKQIGPEPVAVPEWLESHRLGRLLRKVTNKDAKAREVTAQSLLRELEACSQEGWPAGESQPAAAAPTLARVDDTVITRLEGERRQLTVVCAGLRLSGAESAHRDEEEADRLLRSLHVACADIARQHDAHVGSVLGEWTLFFFGYPRAREDDARRAGRAALEMIAAMERRATELAREHKGQLEFRVGIHTGLVISQELRARGLGALPALVGGTPNAAVRLEMQAEPGTVLVSAETSKLLRGFFAFEPVGAAREGDEAQTPQVLRLLHEYRSLNPSQLSDSSSARLLFGRGQELELLLQRWWQVVGGTGQSVLLTGEPGIGKSRLVQEMARQVRSAPHALLECRCVSEGKNSALHPMVDLLERLLGISRDWTPEQTTSALEALLSQYGFQLPEVMPLFLGLLSVKGSAERYPPLAVVPERAKELTLEALMGLFFEMAQEQPLLLIVEDLHWADPTTLELLSELAKDISTARLCLLLTSRPEFALPWAASHHMQLSRLDRQGMEAMVASLMKDKPLPREVVEQLVNRADGVPLFVEELTRAVTESLPTRSSDTPSRLTPNQLTIPTTLRDSLMARLDRLGSAKEVAQLASALGREFSYEVLKAVSLREEAELQRELKALVDADLVHRRRGVRNPTYLFKHALIRDTAYESMLKPVRRQVHARIASTLEAHFPELVETRPDLLAMHHAAADQKRQALDYAQKAALASLMRSALQETIAHATEALSWLSVVEDERERAQIELAINGVLAPAMMDALGWADERIKTLVERSQALIDFLGDSPLMVTPLWALAVFYYTRGQISQTRALSERLMLIAEQQQDTDLKLMTKHMSSQCFNLEGRQEEARDTARSVLDALDVSHSQMMALKFGFNPRSLLKVFLSLVEWTLGHAEKAAAHANEGLAWAKESNHPGTLALATFFQLTHLQMRGEREQLIPLADTLLELTRRFGLSAHTLYGQMLRCWATRDVQSLRRDIDFQVARGMELGMTYYKSLLAELELEAGRFDAALQVLDSAIGWGRSVGENYRMSELLRLKGLCLQAQGNFEGAEACLRQAIEIAREQAAKMLELKATRALAELLVLRGRSAEGRERLAPLLQWFTEGRDATDVVQAQALLGKLLT